MPDAASLSWLNAVLLGVVQGLTEFLPVSSSAHLVLAEALLGVKEPGIALELVLHAGTLLAVLLYYRKDLGAIATGALSYLFRGARDAAAKEALLTVGLLIVGTLPAVIGALTIGDKVEAAFADPHWSSMDLMITGTILLATRLAKSGTAEIGFGRALWIGICQLVALFPGISRSGMTVAGALFAGVRPERAARFSFLLSIPAVLGAIVFKADDIGSGLTEQAPKFALGAVVSFVFGWLAIDLMIRTLKRGRLAVFGIYCLIVGLLGVLYFRGN